MKSLISMMVRLFLLTVLLVSAIASAQKHYLVVGTYTKGKSKGIYLYEFNTGNGETRLIDSTPASNPSYLAVSPDQQLVYAVSETVRGNNSGQVRAFRFDKDKEGLVSLNQQSSM